MQTNSIGTSVPTTIQPPQLVWLTAAEAAAHLKVGTRTILSWARDGKLKGYQLSGIERHVWRFLQSDLDAMLISPSAPCLTGRVQ